MLCDLNALQFLSVFLYRSSFTLHDLEISAKKNFQVLKVLNSVFFLLLLHTLYFLQFLQAYFIDLPFLVHHVILGAYATSIH